jgi:aerotaxis receptor
MRQNLPITEREHHFAESDTLVTTTDLQGRILYCNAAFVEASGYAREELLGQPHNLIRHPHMPEEAFRDMWDTIAKGSPWSGLVKNRRKCGDHYWVRANVTPLLDDKGQVTGYMSVRTCPSKEATQRAEALYQQMREEAASGRVTMQLQRGKVVPHSTWGKVLRHLRPGLRGKMSLTSAAVGALGFFVGEYQAGGLMLMTGGEVLIGVGSVILCAYAGGWYLKRLIAVPITRLVNFANQIAGGNLTQDLETRRSDEIGQLTESLAQLNANLMSIVRDARTGMHRVRDGSGTIAEGNLDLSQRTESAASSLQETAASMEQITTSVRQSTDVASQAASRAGAARDVAHRSGQAVGQLSATMTSINEASRRISDIIQVVDGIAFQTNILALNAAVEAARAGEQGRGFAVVAGEVRTLAQRTSTAAKEIRGLIQTSVDQVSAGDSQTHVVQDAMGDVQKAIDEVHAFIEDISHGMQEQMLGVSQVNQAISQMDSLTQQNAALVEEIAASASDLNAKADDVAASVSIFKLKGDKAGGAGAANAVALRKAAKQSLAAQPGKSVAAASAPVKAAVRATSAPAKSAHAAHAPTPAASSASQQVDESEWASF